MNKFSFKELVQNEVAPLKKAEPLWTPIEIPIKEEKKVEFKVSKPRKGIKSLLDLNEDIVPVKTTKVFEPSTEKLIILEEPSVVSESIEIVEELKKDDTPYNFSPIQSISLADRAVDQITKEVKLEEKADSFQQPNPVSIENNFLAVTKKLKFLEQAIGKISAHGPGSGETRFFYLDDVARNTVGDTHKLLRFRPSNVNPAFSDFYFDFLSGDQGPVNSLRYDTSGYTGNATVTAGLTAWNSNKDCIDIYQSDGTILQVGLENYIRVSNETGNILLDGEFVVFSGINGTPNNPLPKVNKFLADSNAIPLYSVGVLTSDVQDNSTGRATVLGEVRNLNTTGNVVGETWYAGNLLWAHPGIPGKLTVNQPTAPNVAVSVAAVLKADPTDGVLLVRPTIFPRLYYGEFSSNQNQVAPNTNFGHYVTFNSKGTTSGFTIDQNNTEITAKHTGLYNVRAKLQFTSSNASQQQIYVWGRKNGIDLPDSTIRVSSAGNGFSNAPIWSRNVSLAAGDRISIVWAVSSTDISLSATTTAFAPNTSSAVFVIYQIDL